MFWLSKLSEEGEAYWAKVKSDDRVDVILAGEQQSTYTSRVIEVNADSLVVETPWLGAIILEVAPKSKLTINLYSAELGILKFNSTVISQEWEKGRRINIAKPNSIERIQRRQFPRVDMILTVAYGVVPSDPKAASNPENIVINLSAVTRNISEGGMLMVGDVPFLSGTLLSMVVELNPAVISVIGRILEQIPLKGGGKFLSRIQFVMIRNEDKETLRQFILSRARRMKENRLI